jgi:hypothetical protein
MINVMEEGFEEVTILGKPALFTSLRLDRATVPPGYFVSEVQDDGQGEVTILARHIMVHHWGSLITRDEIELPGSGYLDINPDDLSFGIGGCRRMKDFMEKYPPSMG